MQTCYLCLMQDGDPNATAFNPRYHTLCAHHVVVLSKLVGHGIYKLSESTAIEVIIASFPSDGTQGKFDPPWLAPVMPYDRGVHDGWDENKESNPSIVASTLRTTAAKRHPS